MNFIKMATASLLIAGLSACGGGDSDASSVDKYVGTWYSPCETISSSLSYGNTLVLSKVNSTTIASAGKEYSYANGTCAGTGTLTGSWTGQAQITGSVTASGKVVDKILDSDGYKDIVYVEGNNLYSSPYLSPLDTDGYPTTLDLTSYMTKG